MRAHNVTPERLERFLVTNEHIGDKVFVRSHHFAGLSGVSSKARIIQQLREDVTPNKRFEVAAHHPYNYVHIRPE